MALYVLDSETGEKLSFTELGTQSISSPALYNTRLYIGGFDNYVYCYEEAPNPPPIPAAQIDLSLSENTVVKGSQLYIEGRVVNVQAAIPLTVSVDNPDSTYEDIPVMTDVNGYFQVIYTPEVLGDLTVFAWCEGGDFYYGGASDGLSYCCCS
jgi:outer membrane protein assembly factor BamB